jgi:hypothetical protein
MPRISVYVPDAMKERMVAVGDRINWSEAAQAAFEREITMATMPEDPNMQQVIDRLRASKAAFVSSQAAEGRQHGRDWAKLRAKYEDLRRIARLELSGSSYAIQVDSALGRESQQWEESFWFEPEGSVPADEYVEAFVEGAKDVWDDVSDKL